MGSFASSMFSVMLGWIRTAVSYVWNAASSPEGSALLHWMGDNWLTLAVLLCLAGVVADAIIHLLRWRSYKVWASFLRRMTGRKTEEEPARTTRTVHRQWLYADGTARTETVEPDELPMEEDPHPWQNVAPTVPDYELDREAYMRQYARPEAQTTEVHESLEDYPQPVQQEILQEPEEEAPQPMRRYRKVARQNSRTPFQHLFSNHDADELDLRYRPAQPAVDKNQAYNKPYYPPQWKPPAEVGVDRDE